RVTAQGSCEVGRHLHLARRRVELDADIHILTRRDTGGLANLRADADHEAPAHRGHCAAIGVAIDRDADRRFLARPQLGDDRCRHFDAGSGLACELDFGAKLHRLALLALAVCVATWSGWENRIWLPNGSRRPQSMP